MALHENFREYTREEIRDIVRDRCAKNKCPYLRQLTGQTMSPITGLYYVNKCCMYIDITGHQRGCMPDECTHYNDDRSKIKRRSKNER